MQRLVDQPLNQPVLLLGAGGMLGRAWQNLLTLNHIEHKAVTRDELDICDSSAIEKHITAAYPVVINCAAWTDVDGAETHEEQAMQINGHAVGRLAEQCRRVGSLLVHFSTDYVFSGLATRPYPANHQREPINIYGRSKQLGEKLLEESRCRYLLLRTSWLYAPWGKNFLRTMAQLMAQRDELNVVNDQRGCPTSCRHLAAATWTLIEKQATGIYHVTDGGECTWYDFATTIAELLGSKCRITPCTTEQFPRPAARPTYSVLDLIETEALIGGMPGWKRNLADVIAELNPKQIAA